jgi:hypothetical protein
MKGAVMRAEEKARVEFVRRALRGGADVVFTSAQLVKEGIGFVKRKCTHLLIENGPTLGHQPELC